MFDLYQAPAAAAHRQAELYAEVAADRLARSGNESHDTASDDRLSPARRVTLVLSDVLSALTGAIHVATRRQRWI